MTINHKATPVGADLHFIKTTFETDEELKSSDNNKYFILGLDDKLGKYFVCYTNDTHLSGDASTLYYEKLTDAVDHFKTDMRVFFKVDI